ncbi:MAG: WYL domain-containing protein [Gammaproteobacteria bacterium]|nr:WYL domain-containing protein [Gammaproteobacteria bacterium]
MDRTERFHLIDQLLNSRRSVTREQFLSALEVSLATFKRDLEYMRDRLGAPIIWQRDINAYKYEHSINDNFQLPGLWFNTAELHALMTMDALLENLQQGMLSQHIKPLQSRVRSLMESGDYNFKAVGKRIRVLTVASKTYKSDYFKIINQALMSRKRLFLKHYNRSADDVSEREVSPQRLTFYRDNWYLDAWCHYRKALRSFSVDAIQSVQLEMIKAKEVKESELDKQLATGYGIFSGSNVNNAVLKFTAKRARWVSREQWHPKQESYFDENGFYILTIPYSNATELIMDILKYGSDVEVLKPKSLREKTQQEVIKMQSIYGI